MLSVADADAVCSCAVDELAVVPAAVLVVALPRPRLGQRRMLLSPSGCECACPGTRMSSSCSRPMLFARSVPSRRRGLPGPARGESLECMSSVRTTFTSLAHPLARTIRPVLSDALVQAERAIYASPPPLNAFSPRRRARAPSHVDCKNVTSIPPHRSHLPHACYRSLLPTHVTLQASNRMRLMGYLCPRHGPPRSTQVSDAS